MFRLILLRIKALSRVGPPPFRRTGRFLRIGMMELGRGGQGVRILEGGGDLVISISMQVRNNLSVLKKSKMRENKLPT